MWIEIKLISVIKKVAKESQPARAVWIEMAETVQMARDSRVTACEGCVD